MIARAASFVLVALLAASPAVAQDNPHGTLATEFYETCARFVARDPAAQEAARDEGWKITPDASSPRFVTTVNGDRNIDGLGTFYFASIVEVYPSTVSSLCILQSFDLKPDWPDLGVADLGIAGLRGAVESIPGGGISGSWERESPLGQLYLVLGRQAGSHFLVQITEITPRVPNQ